MKQIWASRLITAAVALVTLGGGVTVPAYPQSLQEAVSIAVLTHPQVLTTARRKDAADAGIDVARGGYFPKIDLLYGRGSVETRNPTTIAAGQNWNELHRRQQSTILNQMLWDGDATSSEVQRRRAISASVAHRVYGTAEEIALQAVEAYLEVLKNRQQVGYARDNLLAHERTFDQIRLRVEQGVGRRADLDQVDARVALAVANLQASESALRDAEIVYERVVGRPPKDLQQPAALPAPKTPADALITALSNHPILKSARADMDAATAQRNAAKSQLSPRFELEAAYGNNKNLAGVAGPYGERSIMLWAKWNVLRGGSDASRIKETGAQIEEATEIANNTQRQVEAAVRLSHNAYTTANLRLPSLDRYVKSADATREAYAKQFAIGQRTLLDLLDSENEFFVARTTQLTGRFIELTASYRLLNAMGLLLTSMSVAPPLQAIVQN